MSKTSMSVHAIIKLFGVSALRKRNKNGTLTFLARSPGAITDYKKLGLVILGQQIYSTLVVTECVVEWVNPK